MLIPRLQNLMPFRKTNLAVDLGNKNTVVWHDDASELISTDTALAYRDGDAGQKILFAVGKNAADLDGRTTDSLDVVYPLSDGMITNVSAAADLIAKVVSAKRFQNFVISVPAGATSVEKRAFANVGEQLGAAKVFVIPEPMSAAIGAGLDVMRARGQCIIDVGDGIVDAAHISMGEIVTSASLRLESCSFETKLIAFLRESHRFHISKREAERAKLNLTKDPSCDVQMRLVGFCALQNRPAAREFRVNDLLLIQQQFVKKIVACVLQLFETISPELQSDLSECGVLLTGGNSLNPFVKREIEKALDVPVCYVRSPLLSVALGNKAVLLDKKLRDNLRLLA